MDKVSKIMDSLNGIEYGFKDKNEIDTSLSYDIFIYKYRKPKYYISCDEFYDYIKTQERINA